MLLSEGLLSFQIVKSGCNQEKAFRLQIVSFSNIMISITGWIGRGHEGSRGAENPGFKKEVLEENAAKCALNIMLLAYCKAKYQISIYVVQYDEPVRLQISLKNKHNLYKKNYSMIRVCSKIII